MVYLRPIKNELSDGLQDITMRFNTMFYRTKILIFLLLVITAIRVDSVNFGKAGANKVTLINNNDDDCDITVCFNLFDSRTSSTFSETHNFRLCARTDFFFDILYYQNKFDDMIKELLHDCPLDKDIEQLKKIFGCIKSVQVIHCSTGQEAKLYVYGPEEGGLKVFILNSSFTHQNAFDCFHIDFNAAVDSKSEYYHDCINNIDRLYSRGFSTKTYKFALDPKVMPGQFIERMKYLYEQYFLSEPNINNPNNIHLWEHSHSTTGINKSLFQVWVGGKPLPEEYKKNQVKWQKILSPDWTYKLYTDEDVAQFEFSSAESRKVYDSLPNPTAQSDLLRMEILNKHGGVYVDLDTEPFESIDLLVSNFDFFGLLLGPNRGNLFIDNYFIGSVGGHPIIKQTIDNIILFISDRSYLNHLGSLDKICPNVLTSIIPFTRAVYQHAGRGEMRDVILPIKYFNNHSTTMFSYATHYPKRLWKK